MYKLETLGVMKICTSPRKKDNELDIKCNQNVDYNLLFSFSSGFGQQIPLIDAIGLLDSFTNTSKRR